MAKQRVAILGGGIAGLATAFYLTSPEQNDRYQVTIYQLGWRLGGKCATGRNPDHNERIQEHGLHVFMGQYQNAFSTIQALYAEASHPPFPGWEAAFTQQPSITLMEQVEGAWTPWVLTPPVFPGTPGVDPPPSFLERVIQFLQWIEREMATTHRAALSRTVPGSGDTPRSWFRDLGREALEGLEGSALGVGLHLSRVVLSAIEALDPDFSCHEASEHHRIAGLLGVFRDWIAGQTRALLWADVDLRHWFIIADLGLANLIGGFCDGLLFDPQANLERVNKTDYRAWLQAHGAAEITANSAIVRGLYDLIFAYPFGEWTQPGNVEAGTLFLSLMSTALYQGSIIWQFNTATGDAVVAPYYEVLSTRGVRFEFFHRVDALHPDPTGQKIESVSIGRQVVLKPGGYDPLRILPSGERVWPDRPLFDQIVDGEKLSASGANLESWWTPWIDTGQLLTLQAGRDYDHLVLAIPPAAHPVICAELIEQRSAWRDMSSSIQTVATQSLQTWTTLNEQGLGFDDPPMVGAFDATNLNSWADISTVLNTECWPPDSGVLAEQIACGPLPCPGFPPARTDTGYPAQIQASVDAGATAYLQNKAWVFWRKAFSPGGPPRTGVIASRYSRANIDPSERYTLTVTGSTRARMTTAGSGYDNLFLAGDWIQNGQNLGSFEATTTAGMLAASAISDLALPISGVDAPALTRRSPCSTPSLPAFVELGGQATFPGPLTLDHTTMWAFMLGADISKLQAWCQAMFDVPSGGAIRVSPILPAVMMTIVDIQTGRFLDAPDMGWSSERELTFWIPVLRQGPEANGSTPAKFDLVLPYLVLDNPVAIASGREIFGYWKQKGWLSLPGDPGNENGSLSVDLFATRTFSESSQDKRERLLTLTPAGARESSALNGVSSFDEAVRRFHGFLTPRVVAASPGLDFGLDLLGDLLAARVPQLFLKQFRDVADGRRACYQAITEAFGHITAFDAVPSLVDFDMTLEFLASSPVTQDFGLVPAQRITGVQLAYDMRIDPGQVLWQA